MKIENILSARNVEKNMKEHDKIRKLKNNLYICKRVIQECKWRLPMIKMTYPEAIITDGFNIIQYNKTIKQCEETITNINKIILQYNHDNIMKTVK